MNHVNPVQLHVLVPVARITGSSVKSAETTWDQVAGKQLKCKLQALKCSEVAS